MSSRYRFAYHPTTTKRSNFVTFVIGAIVDDSDARRKCYSPGSVFVKYGDTRPHDVISPWHPDAHAHWAVVT